VISKDKKYRTRDGREVRIYATDGCGDYPIHGAILYDGVWQLSMWLDTGSCHRNVVGSAHDLIEDKPRIKRECWLLVYPDGTVHDFYEKESALRWYADYGGSALILVQIDCEEGEGL